MFTASTGKDTKKNFLGASIAQIPFGLFLASILAYGSLFAFSLLTKFDLVNLIRDGNYDDAYYYFQIAKNLSEGHFSTFDGGITRTNGYHPLWMLLITPFYWIFDPKTALFGIILVTGAVVAIVLAARMARLPWILLFAVLPELLSHRPLIRGVEAGAALFMLGILFLFLSLFARNPVRWQWPLSVTAFSLPWVRLEYVAISMATMVALCLGEWSQREDRPLGSASLSTFVSSISSLKSTIPFAGACAGILAYFAYNGAVFGSILPVSGAVKLKWAQWHWTEGENEYSFLQNFQDMMQILPVSHDELLAAMEVCAYLCVVIWFANRSRRREDYMLSSFLIGVFGLGVGHLAQLMYAALFLHPGMVVYSDWYYVPAYSMMALIIPVRCMVSGYFIRRLIFPKFPRVANVAASGILATGMFLMFDKVTFTDPYLFVDQQTKHLNSRNSWHYSSYAGTWVMNRILPEESIVGSWDAGIIGYFSRVPVVELGGLVNSKEYSDSLDGYESSADVVRSFGITHFANGFPAAQSFQSPGRALFEGFPFKVFDQDYEFKIMFVRPPWASSSEVDPIAWFWKRMDPHFDHLSRSGDLGVVIDGRLVLLFAKDCAAEQARRRILVLQWTPDEGDSYAFQRPWRQEGQIPYICGDVSLLPQDATHLVRIVLGTENNSAALEDGFDNWRLDGDAVTMYDEHERIVDQSPITGNVTKGFLTTYHPNRGDAEIGTARSPEFSTADGQLLTFLIAGGKGEGIGVRLLADGAEVNVWRGKNSEYFETASYPLDGLAGKTLQLELFDFEIGSWGHIMLDHVRLLSLEQLEQRDESNE